MSTGRITNKRWLRLALPIGLLGLVAVFAAVAAGGSNAAGAAAPQNTSPPTITGTPQQGHTLVGDRGKWSGSPTDYNDFWVRCDKNGGSCSNISGATDRTGYLLKSVDVGNTIRFQVQAKNADGSTFASSVPTAVITAATTPPPPVSNGCAKTGGTIPVAGITPPARLLIDQTQVTPSTITYGTRSITARFHVSACGGSVEGDSSTSRRCRTASSRSPTSRRPTRPAGRPCSSGARRLPGQQQAAVARDVRARPQVGRGSARRHLHPPARLLPRHPRLTTMRRGAGRHAPAPRCQARSRSGAGACSTSSREQRLSPSASESRVGV